MRVEVRVELAVETEQLGENVRKGVHKAVCDALEPYGSSSTVATALLTLELCPRRGRAPGCGLPREHAGPCMRSHLGGWTLL